MYEYEKASDSVISAFLLKMLFLWIGRRDSSRPTCYSYMTRSLKTIVGLIAIRNLWKRLY